MIWRQLQHLFAHDDGSLPDIFVEDLSPSEIVEIYDWVLSLTSVCGDPCVWDKTAGVDRKIADLTQSPARLFIDEVIEGFRHGLQLFAFNGVVIPQLTICIESKTSISFDYRMGQSWKEPQLIALLGFLAHIRALAPACRVFRCDEGCYESPAPEFGRLVKQFIAGRT